MFESGRVNTQVEVQNPSDGTDAMGAPQFGWVSQVPQLLLFAYPENEVTAVDSLSTGPREEAVRTMTLVTRNHPGISINTRQRLVNTQNGEIYRINAIRFDAKQTTCFIDVVTGESNG
jgi:hypothetical protein